MEDKAKKTEDAINALKELQEIEETLELEKLIHDNKIVFNIKDEIYRINKIEFEMQEKLNSAKRKKFFELMDDDSYVLEETLVEKYLKKGKDIPQMEKQINTLNSEMQDFLFRLAPETEPKSIEKLKKEITSLRNKIFKISMEKTDLLEYSIENQLLIYENEYAIILSLEKKNKDNGKWEKCFKTYNDFKKCENNQLINKAVYFLNQLNYLKGLKDNSESL